MGPGHAARMAAPELLEVIGVCEEMPARQDQFIASLKQGRHDSLRLRRFACRSWTCSVALRHHSSTEPPEFTTLPRITFEVTMTFMVELVVTACLLAQPSDCTELRTHTGFSSAAQCERSALVLVAGIMVDHPRAGPLITPARSSPSSTTSNPQCNPHAHAVLLKFSDAARA